MIRMKATPPVATFTAWPTRRIRSALLDLVPAGEGLEHVVGGDEEDDQKRQGGRERPARAALEELSRSRSPRACRSAANGEKTRFSDVRKRSSTWEIRRRVGVKLGSSSKAASTQRSAQKIAWASKAAARGRP